MENNKYMILLVSRMNHRTLSVLRVYLGAGDGDLGRSGVGAAQCTALGRRCADEHQDKDLGCPGQGCADSAPVVQHGA